MADIKISDLTAATNVASTDLLVISQDQGGGAFASRKITGANIDMVRGIRYYGALAADPTTLAPADGDEYYNTVLDKKMFYDGGRAKWISVETIVMYFSRSGNTAVATYYRASDGLPYSATNGFYLPWNAVVTGIGYTRDDTDAATFEVTADGAGTAATLASAALEGSTTVLNVNVNSGVVLGVRNQTGGNTTTNVHGWVFLKWRV